MLSCTFRDRGCSSRLRIDLGYDGYTATSLAYQNVLVTALAFRMIYPRVHDGAAKSRLVETHLRRALSALITVVAHVVK